MRAAEAGSCALSDTLSTRGECWLTSAAAAPSTAGSERLQKYQGAEFVRCLLMGCHVGSGDVRRFKRQQGEPFAQAAGALAKQAEEATECS